MFHRGFDAEPDTFHDLNEFKDIYTPFSRFNLSYIRLRFRQSLSKRGLCHSGGDTQFTYIPAEKGMLLTIAHKANPFRV
jgi:hypothetical protein